MATPGEPLTVIADHRKSRLTVLKCSSKREHGWRAALLAADTDPINPPPPTHPTHNLLGR